MELVLGTSPCAAPLSRLGKVRGVGITDLCRPAAGTSLRPLGSPRRWQEDMGAPNSCSAGTVRRSMCVGLREARGVPLLHHALARGFQALGHQRRESFQ